MHNQTEQHSAFIFNYSPNNSVTSQKSETISDTAVRDSNLTDILVIQQSLFTGVLEDALLAIHWIKGM